MRIRRHGGRSARVVEASLHVLHEPITPRRISPMRNPTYVAAIAAAALSLLAAGGAQAATAEPLNPAPNPAPAPTRITGTVMDINGSLVVVRNTDVTTDPTLNFTYHTVMLPPLVSLPAGL